MLKYFRLRLCICIERNYCVNFVINVINKQIGVKTVL